MSLITHLQQLRGEKSAWQASREAARYGQSNFYLQGPSTTAFFNSAGVTTLRSKLGVSDVPMVGTRSIREVEKNGNIAS